MKILLWNIRAEKKITLKELASVSGISKSSIHRIETGAVSPTMETMERLARAMHMKITDLFESEYK